MVEGPCSIYLKFKMRTLDLQAKSPHFHIICTHILYIKYKLNCTTWTKCLPVGTTLDLYLKFHSYELSCWKHPYFKALIVLMKYLERFDCILTDHGADRMVGSRKCDLIVKCCRVKLKLLLLGRCRKCTRRFTSPDCCSWRSSPLRSTWSGCWSSACVTTICRWVW